MENKYYYITMSQIDMLQNQVLEEILRERANYYLAKNRPCDFWVLLSPNFMNNSKINKNLKNTKFYNQHKGEILDGLNSEFYSSLITLDKDFIKWIKLRLGYFEDIDDFDSQSNYKFRNSSFVSDGICGKIIIDSNKTKLSPLQFDKNFINPKILSKKFEKSLEIYYSIKKIEDKK